MSVPIAFFTVLMVWSTTALAIKWSVDQISFLASASLRMSIATVLCALVIAVMRWPFPVTRAAWRVYGIVGAGLFFGLGATYWAAQSLNSGLLAMAWGLAPLFTALIASLVLKERFGWVEAAGIALALYGLWLVFATGQSLQWHLVGTLALLLLGILIQSVSLVALKYWGQNTPAFATTTGGVAVAALLFSLSWLIFDRHIPTVLHQKAVAAIVYLAVIGNLVGLGAYNYLVKQVTAGKASLIMLLSPVLALILGHWLNAELISSRMVCGVLLVLSGLLAYQRPWLWFKANKLGVIH